MIKVAVTAPRGKQASLIIQEILLNENYNKEIKLVGCIGPAGRDYIGKDAGLVSRAGIETGVLVSDDIKNAIEEAHIVVDFSTRELSMEVLEACVEMNKGLICGTTAFSPEEIEKIKIGSKKIPLLKAANTSRMVNVMSEAAGLLAKLLEGKCDIEVIDMHCNDKLDSPSGTAKELGLKIASEAQSDVGNITFHSVRAGNTPSSHTIIFGGMGERIELTHHAYDLGCCARGACDAIIYLYGKEPGLYKIEEVFGL